MPAKRGSIPAAPQQNRNLRIAYALLLGLTLAFALYEELHLRRWLFHHNAFDAVLAGSLPNFLAVLVLGLACTVLKPPKSGRDYLHTVASITAGLTLYEFAQIWMPSRVFDWNDIVATLLGGIFTWLIVLIPLGYLRGDRGF